jgi:hypothetical protein
LSRGQAPVKPLIFHARLPFVSHLRRSHSKAALPPAGVLSPVPVAALAGPADESQRVTTSRDKEIRALLETALRRPGESERRRPREATL